MHTLTEYETFSSASIYIPSLPYQTPVPTAFNRRTTCVTANVSLFVGLTHDGPHFGLYRLK